MTVASKWRANLKKSEGQSQKLIYGLLGELNRHLSLNHDITHHVAHVWSSLVAHNKKGPLIYPPPRLFPHNLRQSINLWLHGPPVVRPRISGVKRDKIGTQLSSRVVWGTLGSGRAVWKLRILILNCSFKICNGANNIRPMRSETVGSSFMRILA